MLFSSQSNWGNLFQKGKENTIGENKHFPVADVLQTQWVLL